MTRPGSRAEPGLSFYRRLHMNREELIRLLGQRLSVGFEGYEVPFEFRKLVHDYKIGNVILFRRNVKDREQLTRLCVELRHIISV